MTSKNPTPAQPAFRDELYERYVSTHKGSIKEHQSQSALDVDIIPRLPDDRSVAILDVGCGQGQLVDTLQRHRYSDSSGIDTSPEQVELAHKLGRAAVHLGDLFTIANERPGAYDVVTAIDVIEHFDRHEVQRVFQAFADLLRPSGRFVFRTPNAGGPYASRLLFGDLTHGVIYTPGSLEQVGRMTGFTQISTFPVRPSGTTMRRRVRRLSWAVIEPVMKLPLIIETGVTRGHIVTQNLVGVAMKGPVDVAAR
jgi:SAM-dependent methyltransferase